MLECANDFTVGGGIASEDDGGMARESEGALETESLFSLVLGRLSSDLLSADLLSSGHFSSFAILPLSLDESLLSLRDSSLRVSSLRGSSLRDSSPRSSSFLSEPRGSRADPPLSLRTLSRSRRSPSDDLELDGGILSYESLRSEVLSIDDCRKLEMLDLRSGNALEEDEDAVPAGRFEYVLGGLRFGSLSLRSGGGCRSK